MTIHYPASVWGGKMGGVPKSPVDVRREIADYGRNRPWTMDELDMLEEAIRCSRTLAECCALFPYRSFHSVKDPFYRLGGGRSHGAAAIEKARAQKTVREGSQRLLMAMVGLMTRKAG